VNFASFCIDAGLKLTSFYASRTTEYKGEGDRHVRRVGEERTEIKQ
jgi:hypothetical protein